MQGATAAPSTAARALPAIEVKLAAPKAGTLIAPDIAFLVTHGFSPAVLLAAQRRAGQTGEPAHRVLIANGIIAEATYVRLLAERLNLGLAGPEAVPDDRVRQDEALRQGWLRATLADGKAILVLHASGPGLRSVIGTPTLHGRAGLVLADTATFRAILLRHFGDGIARTAATSVPEIESARMGITRRQTGALAIAGLGFAAATLLAPAATLLTVPLALGLVFLAAAILQIGVTLAATPGRDAPVERRDDRLPRYSVLVPLYREANVVGDLVAALAALDYPKELLQILLVTEAHDQATQEAIRALTLPGNITMFVAPAGTPHTKPRAINAALPFATGAYVVVYDAEDRPDPLQLRAAVAAFRDAAPEVACLQARLAIDNGADSWLTRMFAIEYAALFDVVKAGTTRLGLPVPLGGTSNHFRTDALVAVGLWDAWNVTEDADLGFRLALHGLAVRDLNSTTDEEAPHSFTVWLNQRTRWLKGWMQTVLTHSRRPLVTWRALGTAGFFAAAAQSACVIAGALGTPLFHVLVLMRILSPEPLLSGPGPNRIADGVMILLGLAGIVCTFLPALIGMARRRLWHFLPWLPLLPVYQLLVSLAAWRALHELVSAPYRWNKTQHGTARLRRKRHA